MNGEGGESGEDKAGDVLVTKAEAAPIGGKPALIASSMGGGRMAPGGEVDGIEVVLEVSATQ